MPLEGFEVIVGVAEGIADSKVAIAHASQYLAYADRTDTYGYHGDTFDVNVYGRGTGPFGIGLCFAAPLPSDDDLKRFMDEMAQLSKVESVERIHYERLD